MRMQPLETLKTPFMVTECCLAVSSVSGVLHFTRLLHQTHRFDASATTATQCSHLRLLDARYGDRTLRYSLIRVGRAASRECSSGHRVASTGVAGGGFRCASQRTALPRARKVTEIPFDT
jgi:hypothetical protein